MLEKGKLRERVKSGEVSAQDARNALLARKRAGEVVSEDAIRWLGNYTPRRGTKPVEEEQPKKQRRKKRRDRKVPFNGEQPALKAGAV
ncbi:MAG: hypothetical protein MN733_11920 [Nitrososphaera sp.]|nr:hypothetical protein [Nitrososphaera sp.]